MFAGYCAGGFDFEDDGADLSKSAGDASGATAGGPTPSSPPKAKAKAKAKAKQRAVKEGELCAFCEEQPRANARKLGC
eukprot:12676701-Alexandrium_andersonii.AAC.2